MSHHPYYSNNNEEDSPELKSPMPWIGIYVAAASLAICLAMAADTFFNGFGSKKFWFPSKISALNAASLTILAIAMKMPLDLSTSMPTSTDQLAKLSSTALMSIAMSKFMPSLGPMDDNELFANITALGVLVITVTGNVCIELGTGLIRLLIVEHALLMLLMLACFLILSSSALIVPSTKKYLDLKYSKKHRALMVPSTKKSQDSKSSKKQRKSKQAERFTVDKLTTNVRKHWMMAETASPQFVMARAVTCSASEAICFLVALILAEAELRLFLRFPSHGFIGNSDYKWSTIFILLIQSVGVVVGTIAPVFKWYAIKFQNSTETGKGCSTLFKTENYWIEKLLEWKKSPVDLHRRGARSRKLVQCTKNTTLCFFITVQILIVLVCKSVWHIFFCFFSCCQCCKKTDDSNNSTGKTYPSHYALYLKDEEKIPERILKNIDDAFNCFIKMGEQNKPEKLIEFLQKYTENRRSIGFSVRSLDSREPPDCWAMPVVTLTSIAIAISRNAGDSRQLVRGVHQGILIVNHIEDSMDSDGKFLNIRNAAKKVWSGVQGGKWLDKDLKKIETLENLAKVAEKKVKEFTSDKKGGFDQEDPPNWPYEFVAAKSMCRLSKRILSGNDGSNGQTDETLVKVSTLIARILSACFTNLPHVITRKCCSSPIEKRQSSVQDAAQLLGETEKILRVLERHGELSYPNPGQHAHIDGWLATIKRKSPLVFSN